MTFQIIFFFRTRSHAKYARTVYPYIPGSFNYYNPRRPCTEVSPEIQLVSHYSIFGRRILQSVYVLLFSVRHMIHSVTFQNIYLMGQIQGMFFTLAQSRNKYQFVKSKNILYNQMLQVVKTEKYDGCCTFSMVFVRQFTQDHQENERIYSGQIMINQYLQKAG